MAAPLNNPFSSNAEKIGQGGNGKGVNDIINLMAEDDGKGDSQDNTDDNTSDLPDDDKVDLLADKGKGDDKNQEDEEGTDGEESEDGEEESDEDREPNEEDLDLVVPVRRKEILAKYPKLFKDFPYLDKAYFREQQYTEILPTIEDAKVALEKSQEFDKFQKAIFSGSTEGLLKSVKDSDPKAYDGIVNNYLPTLAKVDQSAYIHVLGTAFDQLIISMASDADKLKNDDLKAAALIVNQYLGKGNDFKPVGKFGGSKEVTPEVDEASKKLESERADFIRERFETARDGLATKVTNMLQHTVDMNIDPSNAMTPYVKRNATKEVLDLIDKEISRDSRFKVVQDKLWEKAISANFSKDAVEKIRSNYLSKARTLLKPMIQKVRNDALKGSGKRLNDSEKPNKDRKGPLPAGRSAGPSDKSGQGKIPKGMSARQFIMSD